MRGIIIQTYIYTQSSTKKLVDEVLMRNVCRPVFTEMVTYCDIQYQMLTETKILFRCASRL